MPFEHFFPLPAEKYILVNASSGMQAKNYDYFNEVLRLIQPYLAADVKIVQMGNKEDSPLIGAIHLQGVTTIPQMMYLIKNSMLVIGNDSSAAHIASGYDIPLVSLYGATHPKIHGPHFGDKLKQRLIESHRNGNKPSYSPQEVVKTINFIKPEEVAKAALDLLGIDAEITQETLHIGNKYHALTFELVLDQVIDPKDFPGIILNARMDYHFDENILYHNVSKRKLCIVTDKPFNIEPLFQLRPNVASIVYLIENADYSVEFVRSMRNIGMPYKVVSSLTGDELAKLKLDLFDLANVFPRKITSKSDLENTSKIDKNTLYRSNRFILSDGKIYLNKVSWRNGQSCTSQRENEATVIDDPQFWEDADYYHIYNG